MTLAACSKEAPPPPPAPPATPPAAQKLSGADAYRAALATSDKEEAIELLEKAVRANRYIPEAWYELGRRKIELAVRVLNSDEALAVQSFREGLEAEKEALRLMDDGKVTMWTPEELVRVRTILESDLRGVDDVLADRDSSLNALRLRVH